MNETKPCPMCGESIVATAKKCRFCNEWLDKSAAPPTAAADPGLDGFLLPVNVSATALVAGYFGLFSLLVLPAPVGLVISISAIRDLQKHPEKSGWGRAIFGLVSSAVFSIICVFMLIGMASRH